MTTHNAHGLKTHFEGKGLYAGFTADRWGKIHTLSIYRVPPGHPQFLKQGHMFSLRVRQGQVDDAHLKGQVRRHANGLPSIHPHTGEIDR